MRKEKTEEGRTDCAAFDRALIASLSSLLVLPNKAMPAHIHDSAALHGETRAPGIDRETGIRLAVATCSASSRGLGRPA